MHSNNKNLLLIILLFFFCGISSVFSNRTSLVNTEILDIHNITTVNITYLSDNVTLYESGNSELIIKEYMNRNNRDYHANVIASGTSLSIEHGKRPWLSLLISDIEIYLPREYKGKLNISTVSGAISSTVDLDVKFLNISNTSGAIRLQHVLADQMNLRTTSGQIQTGDIRANSEINTTSGQVRMENLTGNYIINTSSARIQLESVYGNTAIKSTSGSISVGSLTGPKQELTSTSGIIDIVNIDADVIKIKTISGRINIERGYGKLSANSTSGKITIAKAEGTANISTVSGSIQAEYSRVYGDVFLKTTSGRVALSLPDDLSFYLDASTTSGAIRTSLQDGVSQNYKSVSRQIGNSPAVNIDISTISGNIDVTMKPTINKGVIDKMHIL